MLSCGPVSASTAAAWLTLLVLLVLLLVLPVLLRPVQVLLLVLLLMELRLLRLLLLLLLLLRLRLLRLQRGRERRRARVAGHHAVEAVRLRVARRLAQGQPAPGAPLLEAAADAEHLPFPDASFDAVIVDSTDPVGVGEVLFTDAFYENCARVLTPRGLVVNQSGGPFMQAEELRETSSRRARHFPHVSAYVAAVPTYVGGFMTLGIAAKAEGLDRVPVEVIRERARAAGILGTTEYWTPEVHVAAFQLPPYIARHLPR